MTDIPEGRITAGKLQSDELQIHLGEPATATTANTLAKNETKKDYLKQNRPPQWFLWWFMIIVILLTGLNLFSIVLIFEPSVFANVTRIHIPCLLFSNSQ